MQNSDVELKKSEQFLLDWGREVGSITHYDLNQYYQAWCKKFYPDIHKERKLKSRFTYQANKLVKLGYFNKPNRIGLGPGSRLELYGSANSQTIWDLFVPKPKEKDKPEDKGFSKLVRVKGRLKWQKIK